MGRSRIADVSAAKVDAKSAATERLTTRVGALIASPAGVLIIVPALVAWLGGVLSVSSERALEKSNVQAAEARIGEQARLVAGSVHEALAQAEPMLDRLAVSVRDHDPSRDFAPFARVLTDLIAGRPGVAYVSASFPDGTFQGAYVEDDGSIRLQDSRVREDGTHVTRFSLGEGGELIADPEERTTYDPRERGFYTLALARGHRVFTEPYPFFLSMHTGITRADPIYRTGGARRVLHAVITVDFDVQAMSDLLEERGLPGTRALLYATNGATLAYSHAPLHVQSADPSRALRYTDLHDPVLDAFFAERRPRAPSLRITTADGAFLVATAPASQKLGWRVAFFTPEAHVLAPLAKYERRSAIVGSSALFIALALSVVFARHITKAKREAEEARIAAKEAQKMARELGSYRLVSMLGKGGMGEVWRAEHRLLSRAAAIKLVNPDVPPEKREELHRRFKREAQALAALRSRNTIEIYDYGVTDEGTFFYVMELLDGLDLESLVLSYGPQPAERVIALLTQICASLAEAHDAGLVHRDIKPANVFVCRAADELDIVKVLDFGLVLGAKHDAAAVDLVALAATIDDVSARITRIGGLLGTPAFMPKEQALGHEVDARADLYAIGGVAFYLLTGKLVFDHPNPMNILFMHVQAELPDLRRALPESVPDAFVELIARCLSKDPAERPASARALMDALRAITCHDPGARFGADEARAFWAQRTRPVAPYAGSEMESAPTVFST